MVKNLPAMQETWVPTLGQEDLLEKGISTHSSILAWRIPWTLESSSLWGCEALDCTQRAHILIPKLCKLTNLFKSA